MNISSVFGRKQKASQRAVGDDQIKGATASIDVKEAAIAGGIGLAAGAGVGALTGYLVGRHEVNQVPTESVTLTWKEPVTQNTTIGSIPHDQYFPANHWVDQCSFLGQSVARPSVNVDLNSTDPVVRATPVLDGNGNPIFREVTKTFTDHGKPIVETHSNTVGIPTLDHNQPYHQDIRDDTHYGTCYSTDSSGHSVSHSQTMLDGVRVSFDPNVRNVPVNSSQANYETKSVSFDSGVDVGGKVLEGMLIGAGVGTMLGVAGDIAKQTLAARHA
jgi:hypothetical protein